MTQHHDACDAAPDCASHGSDDALTAAMLQARALCVQAALVTRREVSTPEEIVTRADIYWAWVSAPLSAQTTGPADLLTRRKRRR